MTFLFTSLTATVLAQGTIIFDSSNASSWVTLFTPPSPNVTNPTNIPAAGSWTAALLFAPGTTLGQPFGNFIQVATTPGNNGYITGPTVTIPASDGEAAGAAGTFFVEGWLGSYPNLASALAAGDSVVGASVEFTNSMGNPTLSPPGAPASLSGWDGSLIMGMPEPSTTMLVVLGAAAMVLFRRKQRDRTK